MRKSLYLFFIFYSITSYAQLGGQQSFQFLDLPSHARLSALGGVNVSHADKDLNFFMTNPSLSGDSLAGWASTGYLFGIADIGQATFTYSHNFKSLGTLNFGVQHINYGEIESYDDTGLEIGSFKSGETVVVVGRSHQIQQYRLGVNLKFAFSNIAGYQASAVLLDIGGIFKHPKKDLTVGMSIRNLGVVLSDYSQTAGSKLPFDIQVGTTFHPEHMPIRFSLTAYQLSKPGDVYDDPSDDEDDSNTLNKLLRHFNFGGEILLHKNFNVLVGYNFLRSQELKTTNSGSGFSFGLAARIKSVEVVFSRASYSVGNANYAFTIYADIEKMLMRREL